LRLHQQNIPNDMLTAITGNKRHQMEYASESDGGVKKSKPRQQSKNEGNGLVKKEGGFHKETMAAYHPGLCGHQVPSPSWGLK
jgi:hypothetical protein